MMKKIIIIPANTDLNRGDQALVWESIRLIHDIYGHKNVDLSLMATEEGVNAEIQKRQTACRGYRFIPTLLKHPGRKFRDDKKDSQKYSYSTLIKWGLQSIYDFLRTFLLLSKYNFLRQLGILFLNKKEKLIIQEIKKADAIYVKGGGFIHSYGAITDPYFIYFSTFHIRLALSLNRKVFVLPNSIGPLKNPIAKKIIINTLLKCTIVTVREKISKDYLDSLSVQTFLYPDLGFFLKPTNKDFTLYLSDKGIPLESKKVIITLRPYRFQGYNNPKVLFSNYLRGIINLVDYLSLKGFHVTFFAHTLGPSSHEDDRIAIKEVLSSLNSNTLLHTTYIDDINLNCEDVEKIYSYYNYMIGTRFHSVIFSLNVNTPSIAIAYGGNKGKGIMNFLGNNDYSIDMDKINSENLISIFEKLELNTDKYISNLKIKKIQIEEQREQLIDQIRKIENIN